MSSLLPPEAPKVSSRLAWRLKSERWSFESKWLTKGQRLKRKSLIWTGPPTKDLRTSITLMRQRVWRKDSPQPIKASDCQFILMRLDQESMRSSQRSVDFKLLVTERLALCTPLNRRPMGKSSPKSTIRIGSARTLLEAVHMKPRNWSWAESTPFPETRDSENPNWQQTFALIRLILSNLQWAK